MKKNYSLITILIIGLTVCVLFLLFSVIIFRYQLNKIFEARCDKIRAAGEPVTLRELDKLYGDVPDDENAALIYEEIFRLYKSPEEVYDIYLKDEKAKGIPDDKIEFKTPSSFLDNILFWGRDVNLIATNELPEKVKVATRMFFNVNRHCLELSRQTEQYSKCRFNLDFSKGDSAWLRHLISSRDYQRFLSVDMSYGALLGDSDRVLMDFREGMKLGYYLIKEPIYFSYLVGGANYVVSIDALKKNSSRVQFTDLQLKEIENIIQDSTKSNRSYRANIGERVLGIRNLENLKKYYKISSTQKMLNKLAPFVGVDILWKLKWLDLFDEILKIEQESDLLKRRKLFDALKSVSFIIHLLGFLFLLQ